ncbi:MAG: hypothetical protein HY042_07165, partial [Spirochaetia bacterium]|nr:hypothetical protein [Spirochaetia bacterium]
AYLIDGLSVTLGPLTTGGSDHQNNLWDNAEEDFARGRPVRLKGILDQLSARLTSSSEFMERTYQCAAAAGGLRVFVSTGGGASESIAAFSSKGGAWVDAFPVVFLDNALPGTSLLGKIPGDGAGSPRAFVYVNPSGQALNAAALEARECAEVLEQCCDTDLILRGLDAREYRELVTHADIFCYFGHGKLVSGLPAIPHEAGWMPLLPDPHMSPGVTIFAACLSGGAHARSPGSGLLIHPVARLCDRKSVFLSKLMEALAASWRTDGGSPVDKALSAWRAAAAADREAGDIRRFIFQLRAALPP